MRWAGNLYTTEKTSALKRKIIRKTSRGKDPGRVWFVSLSSNGRDLFDVFCATQLLTHADLWQDPYIVGIAEDRESAFELVRVIVDDLYRGTGGFDAAAFFGLT